MPASLLMMRDLLLPGLLGVSQQWGDAFMTDPFMKAPQAPHIWVPKLTVPQALAVGAATAIIKNPEVTRRFWSGWLAWSK